MSELLSRKGILIRGVLIITESATLVACNVFKGPKVGETGVAAANFELQGQNESANCNVNIGDTVEYNGHSTITEGSAGQQRVEVFTNTIDGCTGYKIGVGGIIYGPTPTAIPTPDIWAPSEP